MLDDDQGLGHQPAGSRLRRPELPRPCDEKGVRIVRKRTYEGDGRTQATALLSATR